jgi:hypothetical protein
MNRFDSTAFSRFKESISRVVSHCCKPCNLQGRHRIDRGPVRAARSDRSTDRPTPCKSCYNHKVLARRYYVQCDMLSYFTWITRSLHCSAVRRRAMGPSCLLVDVTSRRAAVDTTQHRTRASRIANSIHVLAVPHHVTTENEAMHCLTTERKYLKY